MSLSFSLQDVRKSYLDIPVLQGCTFSFDRKGVYALMGSNGSGKSTLLRICSLLEDPDSGCVSYHEGGLTVRRDLALMRRITLVLAKVGVFNSSVARNAAYGLRVRGISGGKAAEGIERALDFVGLSHKRRQNALTLSSGETQRLGIARALAIEPEILFLDEPTASVDEKNREIIEELIVRMRAQGNVTIILTTHDSSQAARLADYSLLLNNGVLELRH